MDTRLFWTTYARRYLLQEGRKEVEKHMLTYTSVPNSVEVKQRLPLIAEERKFQLKFVVAMSVSRLTLTREC